MDKAINKNGISLRYAVQLFKKEWFYQGTPSLAGRSLFQNSPPDCFEIHHLRGAL